jgi:hypothetical protein
VEKEFNISYDIVEAIRRKTYTNSTAKVVTGDIVKNEEYQEIEEKEQEE